MPIKPLKGKKFRFLLGGALAAGLLVFFFRGMDFRAVVGALRAADPWLLAGAFGAAVTTYLLRSWRWGYLLSPMGRVPFSDLFSATVVGFLSGLAIPRAGEILRPYLVSRRHPAVSTSAGFATIILERVFDLLTVLLLFAAYLFVLPIPASQTQGPLMGVVKAAGASAAVGALVLLALLFAFHARAEQALRLCERVLRLFPAWLAERAGGILKAFTGGLAVLQAPAGHLLAIAGQSFLVWLSIALTIWLNDLAFGVDLPFHATFLVIAFLTVGVAIPTPGMVGGFHAFFVVALADVFSVPRDVAGAAALACHALSNLPVLVFGLFFLGREGLSLDRVASLTEDKAQNAAGNLPAQEVS